MREEPQLLVIENITLFILLGVKACVVYEGDRQTDCYIDQ